ncbi:MAG: glycosyl hydrolase family 8 [Nocardioides sp.]
MRFTATDPVRPGRVAALVLTTGLAVALTAGSWVDPGWSRAADRPSGPATGGTEPVATRPFPQHVRYASTALKPTNATQDEMDTIVLDQYALWKATYLRFDGGEGSWIEYDGADSTVSEAHGYGMVLAAYLGDKAVFDSMYGYATHHPSNIGPHLMAWKQTLQGGRMVDVEGGDSATDGDLDIAYALLLAHVQWGSDGIIDYRARAREVIHDIRRWDVAKRFSNFTSGDWTRGDYRRYTRSSDFMASHVLAFARYDRAHAARWRKVYRQITKAVDDQLGLRSRRTGLLPDFLTRSGARWVPVRGRWLESRHDGDFYWNACRTPWRLAVPWLVDRRTDTLAAQRRTARWIRGRTHGHPARIRAGYYVRNGRPGARISGYRDLAFSAPMAVNAMVGRGRAGPRWMNRTWASITGRDYPAITDYYGDAIRMQALLIISGNWWTP